MDDRLRRLERAASEGDEDARAQLAASRIRIGALDPSRVGQAAHLSDPVALRLGPEALPKIDCTCGGLKTCSRCKGAGAYSLPTDLVPFVRRAGIDIAILLAWACDCAEHVLPRADADREPLRTIIGYARELSPADLQALSARTGTLANCMVMRAVQLLVNTAERIQALASPEVVRQGLAGVVTCAYRAAGNTRAERDWQIAALTSRLLG